MVYGIIVAILLPVLIYRVISFYWSIFTLRNLPPGPFPLPVLGNLHVIGTSGHVSLMNLAKKYGDVMTIYFGSERAVIVSSAELAREVLVQQSVVFGGRPTNLPYGALLLSHNGKNIAFREMNARWKKQRKIFHSAVKSFGSGLLLLENQVCDIVEDLVTELGEHQGTPRDIEEDVRLCVSNVICAMTFGSKYSRDNKEFKLMMKTFDVIQEAISPGNLVNIFPFLRRLPIRQVQNLENAVKLEYSIVERKYREHEFAFDDDNLRDLTDSLLKQQRIEIDGKARDDVKLTDEEVKLIISDTFFAGIETSTTSILWGIYYLALNPEVQDKVHEEMREFLTPGLPPTYHDRRDLPFLQATVTEVYRCSSVAPLLLPHRAVVNASISGYHIPEGTMVLVNAWAIHHDPRLWDNPHSFRPARFIGNNGSYSPPDPYTFLPFSAGKRNCIGEVLAKMVVFVTLARMLFNYRFSLVSEEVEGAKTLKSASILKPNKFRVVLKKRK